MASLEAWASIFAIMFALVPFLLLLGQLMSDPGSFTRFCAMLCAKLLVQSDEEAFKRISDKQNPTDFDCSLLIHMGQQRLQKAPYKVTTCIVHACWLLFRAKSEAPSQTQLKALHALQLAQPAQALEAWLRIQLSEQTAFPDAVWFQILHTLVHGVLLQSAQPGSKAQKEAWNSRLGRHSFDSDLLTGHQNWLKLATKLWKIWQTQECISPQQLQAMSAMQQVDSRLGVGSNSQDITDGKSALKLSVPTLAAAIGQQHCAVQDMVALCNSHLFHSLYNVILLKDNDIRHYRNTIAPNGPIHLQPLELAEAFRRAIKRESRRMVSSVVSTQEDEDSVFELRSSHINKSGPQIIGDYSHEELMLIPRSATQGLDLSGLTLDTGQSFGHWLASRALKPSAMKEVASTWSAAISSRQDTFDEEAVVLALKALQQTRPDRCNPLIRWRVVQSFLEAAPISLPDDENFGLDENGLPYWFSRMPLFTSYALGRGTVMSFCCWVEDKGREINVKLPFEVLTNLNDFEWRLYPDIQQFGFQAVQVEQRADGKPYYAAMCKTRHGLREMQPSSKRHHHYIPGKAVFDEHASYTFGRNAYQATLSECFILCHKHPSHKEKENTKKKGPDAHVHNADSNVPMSFGDDGVDKTMLVTDDSQNLAKDHAQAQITQTMPDDSQTFAKDHAQPQITQNKPDMVTQVDIAIEQAEARQRKNEEHRRRRHEEQRKKAEHEAVVAAAKAAEEAELAAEGGEISVARLRRVLSKTKSVAMVADAVRQLEVEGGLDGKWRVLYEALFAEDAKTRLSVQIKKRKLILQAVGVDRRSQVAQLHALEYFVGVADPDRLIQVSLALKALYNDEMLDAKHILAWHENSSSGAVLGIPPAAAEAVRQASAKFVRWLQGAESDEECEEQEDIRI